MVSIVFFLGHDEVDRRRRFQALEEQSYRDFELIEADSLREGIQEVTGTYVCFSLPGWIWHRLFLERHLEAYVGWPELTLSVSGYQLVDSALAWLASAPVSPLGGTVMRSHILPEHGEDISREFLWETARKFDSVLLPERLLECAVQPDLTERFGFWDRYGHEISLAMGREFTGEGRSQLALELSLESRPEEARRQAELALESVKSTLGMRLLTKQRFPHLAVALHHLESQVRRLGTWPPLWAVLAVLGLGLNRCSKARSEPSVRPVARSQGSGPIVGVYFTSKPCPQRYCKLPKDASSQVLRWCQSVLKLGLTPVLIHDGLSCSFLDVLKGLGVELRQVELTQTREGPNDFRFRCFLDYLLEHPEIEQAFFTDVLDLVVRGNPFELARGSADLAIGREECLHANSIYMWKVVGLAYGWQGRLEFSRLWKKPVLNCGILGGGRGALIPLLEELIQELDRSAPEVDSNMAALNFAAYRLWTVADITSGFPLHNRFKCYEPTEDAYFEHK